ncbi:hypothetical protein CIRG_04799 [Coccidioides immitis RMSCC 2394]|uniref:Uncharacterized protein n=1 Tax=Coccidioides immitis RMSCC 2394 TaxID=404692 RepID=A0A0J6YDK3_COCIT|nr:hypothetical protein CIRG_04799 [Coccidioides immitis RMSCC 2394]
MKGLDESTTGPAAVVVFETPSGSDGSLHASRRLSYNLGSTGVYAKISVEEFCRSSCGNSARRMWRWGNDSGALVGGDDRAGGTANPARLDCSVRVNLILEHPGKKVMGKLETKVPATWAPERALTPGSKGSTGERLKK